MLEQSGPGVGEARSNVAVPQESGGQAVYDNPVYWRNVIVRSTLYGVGCVLSIALILTESKGMTIIELGIIALLFIALFFLFVGWPEIVKRPKRVEM